MKMLRFVTVATSIGIAAALAVGLSAVPAMAQSMEELDNKTEFPHCTALTHFQTDGGFGYVRAIKQEIKLVIDGEVVSKTEENRIEYFIYTGGVIESETWNVDAWTCDVEYTQLFVVSPQGVTLQLTWTSYGESETYHYEWKDVGPENYGRVEEELSNTRQPAEASGSIGSTPITYFFNGSVRTGTQESKWHYPY